MHRYTHIQNRHSIALRWWAGKKQQKPPRSAARAAAAISIARVPAGRAYGGGLLLASPSPPLSSSRSQHPAKKHCEKENCPRSIFIPHPPPHLLGQSWVNEQALGCMNRDVEITPYFPQLCFHRTINPRPETTRRLLTFDAM